MESDSKRITAEKLIRFFKSLPARGKAKTEPEFPDRGKTEEEYRDEQAEWLAQVERKRKIKQNRR